MLTMVQDAMGEVGLPVPTSVIGNANLTVQQFLGLLQRTGNNMVGDFVWQQLIVTYTFNTASPTLTYALPADYDRMMSQTYWNRTQKWPLIGPLSDAQLEQCRSGLVVTAPSIMFRIAAGMIELVSVPTAAQTIAFEYVSKNWIATAGSPFTPARFRFQVDTDVALLDEDVLTMGAEWRWLAAKGLPYTHIQEEYEDALQERMAANRGFRVISPVRQMRIGPRLNVPEGNFNT